MRREISARPLLSVSLKKPKSTLMSLAGLMGADHAFYYERARVLLPFRTGARTYLGETAFRCWCKPFSSPLATDQRRIPAADWNAGLEVAPRSRDCSMTIWNDRPKFQLIPKIRLLSGGDQKMLFPSNLDRREGTCLESAMDLLIPRPS
jgi:hypothetical protein